MKVRISKKLLKNLHEKAIWCKKRKVFRVYHRGQVSLVSEIKSKQ